MRDPQVDVPLEEELESLERALVRLSNVTQRHEDALRTIAQGSSDAQARGLAKRALFTPASGDTSWDVAA